MTEPRTIGVGLVSVGWMGAVHTRAYRDLPLVYPDLGIRPRLVHAADSSEERAAHARDVLGYERASTDYRDVLADPEVEVVSICAPNFLHAEMAIAAAAAGKHVWIEKPAGRGAAETQAIADAAHAAGVVTSVGFNYRNAPAIEHARAIVAAGDLGRITNVRGAFFADYSSEPNGALSWRFTRALAGSGVLGDLMGHLIDLVHHLLGPVAEVTALTSTVYAERPKLAMGQATHFAVVEGGELGPVENEDHAAVLVRLADDAVASGAVGTLEASRVAVGPRASYALEIYGTEGSLRWDFERMNELEVAIGRSGPHVGYTRVMAGPGFGEFDRFQPGAGTGMGYDDLKVVEARKFLEAVAGGPAVQASIDDAVAANRVVDAAERSAASREWTRVDGLPAGTGTAARRAGA